jgi:hypothetical protein
VREFERYRSGRAVRDRESNAGGGTMWRAGGRSARGKSSWNSNVAFAAFYVLCTRRSRTMANIDRAFRVIVLGGIALAGIPATACGGSEGGSSDAGSFPDEGEVFDAGGPEEGLRDAFPSETATFIDASFDASADAFPQEGPAMIDSGPPDSDVSDATGITDGFPQEAAQVIDP